MSVAYSEKYGAYSVLRVGNVNEEKEQWHFLNNYRMEQDKEPKIKPAKSEVDKPRTAKGRRVVATNKTRVYE